MSSYLDEGSRGLVAVTVVGLLVAAAVGDGLSVGSQLVALLIQPNPGMRYKKAKVDLLP